MHNIKIIIDPVGLDLKNPTRYSLYAENIPGSAMGNTKSLTEAESWRSGIYLAINEAYKQGKKDGLNRS